MAKAVRKTSARSKPKSARNAGAKKVKRATTRRSTAAKRTAAKKTTAAKPATRTTAAPKVADDVMKVSTEAFQNMFKNATSDAQQQMLQVMGKEGAEQFAKSADNASRSMHELFSISKDGLDACVTSGSVAVSASKQMGAELFNYANRSFSQNVELSKELLSCRTLNDMFDLQSKLMKTNLDAFFNESVKMSELMFECATKASEPLNESVSKSAKHISKVMTEAA